MSETEVGTERKLADGDIKIRMKKNRKKRLLGQRSKEGSVPAEPATETEKKPNLKKSRQQSSENYHGNKKRTQQRTYDESNHKKSSHRRKENDGGFIDRNELKRVVTECQQKGLTREELGVVVKKWKRTEYRRLKRQHEKQLKKVCFNCRRPGHRLADCPEVLGAREFAVGICFKCGSTEHTVGQCRLKIKNFPYAKCFVCGESGHLSRNCEQNPNGAFPDGGSCKLCGSLNHLMKDCPTAAATTDDKRATNFTARGANDNLRSADDDFINYEIEESTVPSKKRHPKVVKF